jgi:hypothetical protein
MYKTFTFILMVPDPFDVQFFLLKVLATNRLVEAGAGTAFPRSNIRIRYSWHTLP